MDQRAGDLMKLCLHARGGKLLMLANELGVFRALGTGRRSPEEIASELGFVPVVTRTLLRALATLEIVIQDEDGRFELSSVAQACLLPSGEASVGENLRYQHIVLRALDHLPDVLRQGRPQVSLAERLQDEGGGFVKAYIRGIADISRRPAAAVAATLAERPVNRLLDVGGGHGAYAAAVLAAVPEAVAEILDLAETLEITRELRGDLLEAGRLELRAGNYHEGELAGASRPDLLLLSHVIHDESPEAAAKLVADSALAVEPGGRVAIHDFAVDETGCHPPFAAMFSVNLALYSEGRVYSRSEYVGMLEGAGLTDVQSYEVLAGEVPNPSVLFVGTRPA